MGRGGAAAGVPDGDPALEAGGALATVLDGGGVGWEAGVDGALAVEDGAGAAGGVEGVVDGAAAVAVVDGVEAAGGVGAGVEGAAVVGDGDGAGVCGEAPGALDGAVEGVGVGAAAWLTSCSIARCVSAGSSSRATTPMPSPSTRPITPNLRNWFTVLVSFDRSAKYRIVWRRKPSRGRPSA